MARLKGKQGEFVVVVTRGAALLKMRVAELALLAGSLLLLPAAALGAPQRPLVMTPEELELALAAASAAKVPCHGCGHGCDANCNCGVCKTTKCDSESLCLGPCNAGHNAKWCGGGPTPPPPPAPPGPHPAGNCQACGYNCDADCNCGHCNTKPGCSSETQCLGPCDSGHNAKWCGAAPAPPGPPLPPAPPPGPAVTWSTAANKLQRNGKDVVLHGLGTTCTEYLLRGIGMKCWAEYNYPQPASLLSKLDSTQVSTNRFQTTPRLGLRFHTDVAVPRSTRSSASSRPSPPSRWSPRSGSR